jgi:hypothetical protein
MQRPLGGIAREARATAGRMDCVLELLPVPAPACFLRCSAVRRSSEYAQHRFAMRGEIAVDAEPAVARDRIEPAHRVPYFGRRRAVDAQVAAAPQRRGRRANIYAYLLSPASAAQAPEIRNRDADCSERGCSGGAHAIARREHGICAREDDLARRGAIDLSSLEQLA